MKYITKREIQKVKIVLIKYLSLSRNIINYITYNFKNDIYIYMFCVCKLQQFNKYLKFI